MNFQRAFSLNPHEGFSTDMRQGSGTRPNWMKNIAGPSKLLLGSLPWHVKQEAR
jgi:hypothetical protein